MSQFFGKAAHIAFVVPNLDRAVARMLATGIGPAYLMREIRLTSRFRGEPHDVMISVAFGYSGSLQYELLEQHGDTPSAYREYLAEHPDGGFHHLAYYCDDFDAALKTAADHGVEFDIVQEFLSEDGSPFEIYLQPRNAADPLLVQLMLPSAFQAAFKTMEEVAAHWDGTDPVRNTLDLLPADGRSLVNEG